MSKENIEIKPVRCIALIKPDKINDKSSGGLFLPETSVERMQYAVDRGTLVDFGDGFFEGLKGPVPAIGDTILYDKFKGTLVRLDKKDGTRQEYRLINDNEIIGILRE